MKLNKKISKKQILIDIKNLMSFIQRININRFFLFVSVILSFIAAILNAGQIGLLIPLLRGIIEKDYSFLTHLPVFKQIVEAFPQTFASSNSLFMLIVVTIFCIAMIHSALKYLAVLSIRNQVRIANSNIRNILFGRYLAFGKLFFDQNHIGNLNTLLMNYCSSVTGQISAVEKLMSQTFTLLAYLSVIVFISWKMTLVTLAIFPLMNFFSVLVLDKIHHLAKSQMSIRKDLDRRIFNILSCIPLVKITAQEEREQKHFEEISNKEVDIAFGITKLEQLVSPIQNICALVALLSLASVFNFVVTDAGPASASRYLVFFFLVMRMVPGFNAINKFGVTLAKAGVSMEAMMAVLEDDSDKHIFKGGDLEFKGLQKGIVFNNLSYAYNPEVPVLSNLSFTIEKGKTTAIVGPTGSGKTTLINLLLRFYDCSPGSMIVDGRDIRDYSLSSLRNYMALVSQDTLLFNETIRFNVAYGAKKDMSDDELKDILRKTRLYDFVNKLPQGLNTEIGDRGIRLSGGEKQRVSISRALTRNAEILVLDEATSSLDSITEQMIQESIHDAIQGRTAIVIAHRLSTIREADKIIVLKDGEIVEEGTLNELLDKKCNFYDYWEAQKFHETQEV